MVSKVYDTIASVTRALAMISLLAGSREGLAVGEITNRLGIEKSVVSRILATLLQDGFVARHPVSESFQLTFKLVSVAYRHVHLMGFPEVVMPILWDLARTTRELVQLAVVEGETLTFVAKAEGCQDERIRLWPMLGKDVPLHATASGKVWLASLPEDRALAIVLKRGLFPITSKTIVSIDEFRRELVRVRQQGYAVSLEENLEGANGVAAAIRPEQLGGVVVGTVVVSGPIYRFSDQKLKETTERVLHTAEVLGQVWPLDLAPLASSVTGGVQERVSVDSEEFTGKARRTRAVRATRR